MSSKKGHISDIFNAILDADANERQQITEQFAAHPAVEAAIKAVQVGDIESFEFGFKYGLAQLTEGVIERAVGHHEDLIFLFMNAQYVECHFKQLLVQFEGSPCSADKSSTIMRALAKHFLSGDEIVFNYAGEVTYHLPKRIFTTQDAIVAYFKAIKALYYGVPEKYLTELKNLAEVVK